MSEIAALEQKTGPFEEERDDSADEKNKLDVRVVSLLGHEDGR